MNSISKGFLFDVTAIVHLLFYVLKRIGVSALDSIDLCTQFCIILFIYGFVLTILYLVHIENLSGESKVIDLFLAVLCLVMGIVIITFKPTVTEYYDYIICGICALHGLGRLFIKNHKGPSIKLLQVLIGSIIMVIGALGIVCLVFESSETYQLIEILTFVCAGVTLFDVFIIILSNLLPRTDLENDDVAIRYSSDEDRIMIEFKRKIKRDEVIDIDKLFK